MPQGVCTILRFSVELLTAEALFGIKLPRRRYWYLFLLPLVVLNLAVNALMAYYCRTYLPAVCRFLLVFGITILIAFSCFHIDLKTALCCGCASYATQFMASKLFNLIEILTESILSYFWIVVLYVLTYAAVYTAVYFLFARRISPDLVGIRQNESCSSVSSPWPE